MSSSTPSSQEKVVILTGASRGIGLATAHYLLTHSHKLILIARTRTTLDALATQYGSSNVSVLCGDMSSSSDGPSLASLAVETALSRWGRLDSIIVNHGSLDPVKKVSDSTVSEWQRGFDVNVFSALGLIQASLPHLRSSHGRIILVSSGAATTAYQGWGCYGATKAVLNHLALTLAEEEKDVTTISVRPGVVDTEMQREIREVHAQAMSEKDRKKFGGLQESGGLLRPEQPGNVIARLAVDGGEEEVVVRGLSGMFLSWNDERLGGFQEGM